MYNINRKFWKEETSFTNIKPYTLCSIIILCGFGKIRRFQILLFVPKSKSTKQFLFQKGGGIANVDVKNSDVLFNFMMSSSNS